MFKIVTLFALCFHLGIIFAQKQERYFNSVKSYEFEQPVNVWNIDNLGNVYVLQGSSMVKLDSTGKQRYVQSIKSLGEISSINPINSMKILLFSEEQQLVCFLDNTLSMNGDCESLDDFQIKNAKLVAISGRSNLIWVYDEFKSTIMLLDLQQDKTLQRVENLKGLIGTTSDITELTEKDNYLYVTTGEGAVFEFDQMLNETGNQYNDFQKVRDRNKKISVSMDRDSLLLSDTLNDEIQRIKLPENSFLGFKFQGDNFYFQSDKKISMYSLK